MQDFTLPEGIISAGGWVADEMRTWQGEHFKLPEGIQENNPGMLSLEEGRKLAELAQGKFVLELGSYTGLSTIVMARAARQVCSVDWHKGDKDAGWHDTLADFMRNVERFGVRDKIIKIVARFEDVLDVLRPYYFDMVYIDGAHDYNSVMQDTKQALRSCWIGAPIVWHDADQEQVKQAIIDSTKGLDGVTQLGPERLAIYKRNG